MEISIRTSKLEGIRTALTPEFNKHGSSESRGYRSLQGLNLHVGFSNAVATCRPISRLYQFSKNTRVDHIRVIFSDFKTPLMSLVSNLFHKPRPEKINIPESPPMKDPHHNKTNETNERKTVQVNYPNLAFTFVFPVAKINAWCFVVSESNYIVGVRATGWAHLFFFFAHGHLRNKSFASFLFPVSNFACDR